MLKHPATGLRYSAENMLNNAHQYGPLTRGLARFSEGLRVFNHGVLLSLNYQLTRPIAKLAGYITEAALKRPNSRVTSFSIGRAIASSIWAAVDAFWILSLAAGNGVAFGGPEAGTKLKFPLNIPLGSFSWEISINSTGCTNAWWLYLPLFDGCCKRRLLYRRVEWQCGTAPRIVWKQEKSRAVGIKKAALGRLFHVGASITALLRFQLVGLSDLESR